MLYQLSYGPCNYNRIKLYYLKIPLKKFYLWIRWSFKAHYLFFNESALKVLAAHELAAAPNLVRSFQMSTGHLTSDWRPAELRAHYYESLARDSSG